MENLGLVVIGRSVSTAAALVMYIVSENSYRMMT